jgi:hypothetical protein
MDQTFFSSPHQGNFEFSAADPQKRHSYHSQVYLDSLLFGEYPGIIKNL